ncbi:MAG: hypothetical protein A2283_12110 [Lentisphaerae bacterium RIFOXYA12_FULL_48_11]|nr:MAG: hypothetical protein A2283_12110 [Lentisphaerae bacterium RIFOXYA12_FULL_48_11]
MKYENWLFGKNGALFKASANGNLELLKELLAEGANINIISQNGYTPLHRAAQNGHTSTVEFLLSNGANAKVESKDRETPMTLAVKNGRSDIEAILRKYMANNE